MFGVTIVEGESSWPTSSSIIAVSVGTGSAAVINDLYSPASSGV